MTLPVLASAQAAAPAPAETANRFAATLEAAERFEVGAMLVERHGAKGRPLILIPGLASGAWVWQETVRQLRDEHVLYVVTLPGFDGRGAAAGKPIANAQEALVKLIETRKLARPVLIGHSLGGTLALAIAAQRPELIGGVVTLDGLPVFPGSEHVSLAQRAQMAAAAPAALPAGPVTPQDQQRFAAQQQQYMRGMGVVDMARADELAKLTARSEPDAVMAYMNGILALDLRAELPKVTAPVLVIAPYFEPDAAQMNISQTQKTDYYASLMAGTPNLKVVSVAPARHFAMFDQPEAVIGAIRNYLKSL